MINNVINPRNGCKDVWNAFMVESAEFSLSSDIPYCTTTANELPSELVSYDMAKALVKKHGPTFKSSAFVHFYIDDSKFDGKRSSIWLYPQAALEILRHFAGVITPDFSTNEDFPDPIKRYNTYRMRAFGYWLTTQKISVINNVRWGDIETWDYCFDGLPFNSIVSIGTVASGIHLLRNRKLFEDGLRKMVDLIKPSVILVYGSANYGIFNDLANEGIVIKAYESSTSKAFKRRRNHEQAK